MGGTVESRRILNDIGAKLMLSKDADNFFSTLDYDAAAIEPPCTPHPAPKLMGESWSPHITEAKGAIAADVAEQKKFGVKNLYPSVAHLA